MYLLRPILIVLLLHTSAIAQTKPILLIYKSNKCPPCIQFDRAMANDKNFCNTLKSRFDIRALDINTEEGKISANQYGILQIPAFIVFVNNKPITKPLYGFSPTKAGKAYLISSLTMITQPEPRTQSYNDNNIENNIADNSIIETPNNNDIIRESLDTTNRRIGDALSELRSDLNRSLSASEEKLRKSSDLQQKIIEDSRSKFNEIEIKISDLASDNKSTNDKVSQLIASQTNVNTKLSEVTNIVSTLSTNITEIRNTTENINNTQLESFEELLNETPTKPIKPVKTAETDKSTGLFGTLVKYGIGAAATVYGWPIAGTALGTAAIGLGISFVSRQLKKNNKPNDTSNEQVTNQPPPDYNPYQHPTTTQQQPSTQYAPYQHQLPPPPPQIKTETRYITKETDIVGESYKEALRKVANTLGDKNPAYKDIAQLIDHTAKEIERGKRKTTNEVKDINPETDLKLLWSDK